MTGPSASTTPLKPATVDGEAALADMRKAAVDLEVELLGDDVADGIRALELAVQPPRP